LAPAFFFPGLRLLLCAEHGASFAAGGQLFRCSLSKQESRARFSGVHKKK
jgi:hypothetical protein